MSDPVSTLLADTVNRWATQVPNKEQLKQAFELCKTPANVTSLGHIRINEVIYNRLNNRAREHDRKLRNAASDIKRAMGPSTTVWDTLIKADAYSIKNNLNPPALKLSDKVVPVRELTASLAASMHLLSFSNANPIQPRKRRMKNKYDKMTTKTVPPIEEEEESQVVIVPQVGHHKVPSHLPHIDSLFKDPRPSAPAPVMTSLGHDKIKQAKLIVPNETYLQKVTKAAEVDRSSLYAPMAAIDSLNGNLFSHMANITPTPPVDRTVITSEAIREDESKEKYIQLSSEKIKTQVGQPQHSNKAKISVGPGPKQIKKSIIANTCSKKGNPDNLTASTVYHVDQVKKPQEQNFTQTMVTISKEGIIADQDGVPLARTSKPPVLNKWKEVTPTDSQLMPPPSVNIQNSTRILPPTINNEMFKPRYLQICGQPVPAQSILKNDNLSSVKNLQGKEIIQNSGR